MQTDAAYQLSIIAWCLSNPLDFSLLLDRMKEFKFSDPRAQKVWPFMVEAFGKEYVWPTEVEMVRYLQKEMVGDATADIITTFVRELYHTETTSLTGEEVKDWVATQELSEAAVKLRDICSEGVRGREDDIIRTKDQLENTLFLFGKRRLGTQFRPLEDDYIDNCEEKISESYGGKPVPLGIRRLDAKLRDGGVRAHNVLIQGPSGVGKTQLALHIFCYNLTLGHRGVYYAIDDSPGELVERLYSKMLERPFSLEEEKAAGTLAETKRKIRHLRDTKYIGDFHGESISPETHTPQDLARELLKLQKFFYMTDRANAHIHDIPEEEWGQIDLVVIDTSDQVKGEGKSQAWHDIEKVHQAFGIIPKKFGCPVFLTTQSEQGAVGASQLTDRSLAGAYGKARPAKLIIGFAQTYDQYHSSITINPADKMVAANLHNMHSFNPEIDRLTKWRPWWLCISKNTRGREVQGAANKVKLPMLIHYASSRIEEDYTRAEELMIVDNKTEREKAEINKHATPPSTKRPRPSTGGKPGGRRINQ